MVTYSFEVNGHYIRLKSADVPITTGGKNVDVCHFSFDSGWNGFNKTAFFYFDNPENAIPIVLDSNNEAKIPEEVLTTLSQVYVGLRGATSDGEEVIQTNWTFLSLSQGANNAGNNPPAAPTPEVYDQILAIANEALAIAQSGGGSGGEVNLTNYLQKTGNASDTTNTFTQATTRVNLTTGEKISVSLGKLMKWFSDLKTVAFTGNFSDLLNIPSLVKKVKINGSTYDPDVDGLVDLGTISGGGTGQDGADGFSPTATVSKVGDTATISITDINGTTTATVKDGTNGADGTGGTGYTSNLSPNRTCKIIGHRGVSGLAPENTLPAYELAGKYGYWGGETDILTTSDGIWVLMHDTTIDAMTNGTGNVSALTLATIKSKVIDAGNNVAMYPNLRVPTFEEYLDCCMKNNIVPVVEIKQGGDSSTWDSLISIIKKHGYEEKLLIISFDVTALQEIRSRSPKIKLQYLSFTLDTTVINQALTLDCSGVGILYSVVTKSLVEQVHTNGLEINVWAVDDYQTVKTLIGYGVDYVSTNILGGVY